MRGIKFAMSLMSLIALLICMPNPLFSSKCHKGSFQGRVRYVQGGACGKEEGTKKNPYSTLAQAQADTSWDTLIILPSTTILDGGITLRSGTQLIGTENPTGIALSPTQPTITNTSPTTNGGNGAVVTGDAVIKNIYFKDTWAAGIRYDNARNLYVKGVLITGHNQGDVLSPANHTGFPPYEVAGIHGQIKNTGKTRIENVIIRNNHTGSGVLEQVYQGARREMILKSCECAELTSSNLRSDINIFTTTGLVAYAIDQGTRHRVIMDKIYLHDFLNNARSADFHAGIGSFAAVGAQQTTHIVDSTFSRIATFDQNVAIHIFAEAFVNALSVMTGIPSDLKITIEGCSFEELPGNGSAAIQIETDNSTTELVVKNSIMTNLLDTIVSFIGGDSTQKETIIGNTASGAEAFFVVSSENFRGSFSNAGRFTDVTLKDNKYNGGNGLGAIVIIPNFDGSSSPWNKLSINAENNCFDGQNAGFAGLLGFDFGMSGAGNATINAHHNSIVGYFFDIADFGANVNYFAQRNWWGQGGSCGTGADCATTQICEGGFCVGPDNVLNLSTGIVDVSDPLRQSIKCPDSCCQGIGTISNQRRAASTIIDENLNRLKGEFKNRFLSFDKLRK